MNIDYKATLPASATCDHTTVAWETRLTQDPPADATLLEVEPGTSGAQIVEVFVNCKSCPATAHQTRHYLVQGA